MESAVKISRKYQIVIPKKAREILQIEAGDHLLYRVEDGVIRLRPKPKSYAGLLRGLHREIWKDVDAKTYVRKERASWDQE